MDRGVAVLARPPHGLNRRRPGIKPVTNAVAFGAQPRLRDLQQSLVHRAVRIVAIHTIVTHRRVLEQERSALLGVAFVAIVVDRVGAQHRFSGAAMWIVAVRAHHLAFAKRHM